MNHAASLTDVGAVPQTERPTADKKAARSIGHIDYIEHFRAITILMIVVSHAFDLAWSHANTIRDPASIDVISLFYAMINGGTFYFVFISGFLYRLVFFERTTFPDMMRKKALYVGLPYLALGVPLAVMQMALTGFHVTIEKHGEFLGENPFVDLIVQIATGQMMTAYWYIPFIMLMFLISPLFDRFIRMAPAWRIAVFIISLAAGFWVHRPYESLDPVHSVVYYANAYLFGILVCEYRKTLMPILTRTSTILTLGALLLAVLISEQFVFHNLGSIERIATDSMWPKGFDSIIVQKYIGMLFFTAVLARWGGLAGKPLSYIAGISFGMYFIHGIVLVGLTHLPHELAPSFSYVPLNFVAYATATLVLTFTIVYWAKRILGPRSRFIIGC